MWSRFFRSIMLKARMSVVSTFRFLYVMYHYFFQLQLRFVLRRDVFFFNAGTDLGLILFDVVLQ